MRPDPSRALPRAQMAARPARPCSPPVSANWRLRRPRTDCRPAVLQLVTMPS